MNEQIEKWLNDKDKGFSFSKIMGSLFKGRRNDRPFCEEVKQVLPNMAVKPLTLDMGI